VRLGRKKKGVDFRRYALYTFIWKKDLTAEQEQGGELVVLLKRRGGFRRRGREGKIA